MYEDLAIDKETLHPISDSFVTYKIPSHLDMPKIEVIMVEEPVPSVPFGAKGVGEPSMVIGSGFKVTGSSHSDAANALFNDRNSFKRHQNMTERCLCTESRR